MAENENPYREQSILYILGAGASANAIPTVQDFQERLELLTCALFYTGWIEDSETKIKIWNTNNYLAHLFMKPTDNFNVFLHQLHLLTTELNNLPTFDTLAKKYHLNENKQGLLDTKFFITSLINYEQSLFSTRLYSLLDFLNSDESEKEANNVISRMNHTQQLSGRFNSEETRLFFRNLKHKILSKYKDKNDQKFSGIVSTQFLDQRYVSFLLNVFNPGSDRHKKIHIVSWNYDTQFDLAAWELNMIDPPSIAWLDLKRKMDKLNGDINSGIKFAFERGDGDTSIADQIVRKWTEDFIYFTDIVIVGYSFPFYNRFIDSVILNSERYKNPPNFYICEPTIEGFERVKTSLQAICDFDSPSILSLDSKKIFHRPDPKNFFIPFSF